MTLDYIEDYNFLLAIYNSLYKKNSYMSIDKIINFINQNPKIREINEKCKSLYQKRLHTQSKISLNEVNTV